ncbi:MAG: trypsin-like peptidase domain-containing protein [Nitrospira sp.]
MISGGFTGRRPYRRCWRTCNLLSLSLCLYLGLSSVPGQAATPTTPEELNNIRVYKHIARSTVLITSAYVSHHHVTQASWKGLGSGVVLDDQGVILTSAHVVDRTAKITLTLHDGKRLPAELVGSDPLTDVALLRVAMPKGSAVAAQLGDSDKLEIGQKVLAIGHPFGLGTPFQRGSSVGLAR